MNETYSKIVLIDDNKYDAELASLVLQGKLKNVEICSIGTAVTFAEVLARGDFDLVVTEQSIQWAEGREILETVKRFFPQCPVIFFTSSADPHAALNAVKSGLDDYISKDSSGLLRLADAVRRLLTVKSEIHEGADDLLSTIDKMPVGVFRVSEDGRMTCRNAACNELLRLGATEADEAPHLESLFAKTSDVDRLVEALSNVRSMVEVDAQLNGAANRWVRISLMPIDSRESIGAREGLVVDVTSYRDALNRLAVRTEELSRSNSDLERFAYVASHDLQEPLSYITRYASLLIEQYGARFDVDAQQYLRHISESGQRLQSMVDDILAYSRISTHGESFDAVDFGEAADTAAETLEEVFQEANAVMERVPLPTLPADRQQIQQLFQNLFFNAVKFRGKEKPRIRVHAQEETGFWRFSVEDNGIGIEPENLKRIFGMFERLHTTKEYPGTGIGLAICQSIVERHGGNIWAESEPGNGATFCFTIRSNGET